MVTSSVPMPAPLSTEKHGYRAKFSGDNSLVQRRAPKNGCVYYLAHPLPQGKVWQITVLSTAFLWKGSRQGLMSGCTFLVGTSEDSLLNAHLTCY